MSIFNSLGSNYTADFAWQSLVKKTDPTAPGQLAQFLRDRYGGEVLLTYKCRQALRLALAISGLPEGSKVAVSGFTCYAVYQAITEAGFVPVYLDIEADTLNFSAATLTKAVVSDQLIRCVIVQNTLGNLCDIEAISAICGERQLVLIEDLAHSIGGTYKNGKEVGTVGDFTVLSFSQDKVIDGVSGGALIIRSPKALLPKTLVPPTSLESARIARDRWYPALTYIIRKSYDYYFGRLLHRLVKTLNLLPRSVEGIGTKFYNLPAWHAKAIQTQYRTLESERHHRQQIALVYYDTLDPRIRQIRSAAGEMAWLRFPILVSDRKSLVAHLKSKKIYLSDTWYDAPIAPAKYLDQTDYKMGACPISEKISESIVNLPTHINISINEARLLAKHINDWFANGLSS